MLNDYNGKGAKYNQFVHIENFCAPNLLPELRGGSNWPEKRMIEVFSWIHFYLDFREFDLRNSFRIMR